MIARMYRPSLAAVTAPASTASAAHADQLQIDGGLSVIGAGYERTLNPHLALQAEAFVFGTYFLPWFDLGDETKGLGLGVRGTWFADASQRGLYVTPYLRLVAPDDESITDLGGSGFTTGVFAGWSFGLSSGLDLRVGAGVQYIRVRVETASGDSLSSTPFVALDATLGYRL